MLVISSVHYNPQADARQFVLYTLTVSHCLTNSFATLLPMSWKAQQCPSMYTEWSHTGRYTITIAGTSKHSAYFLSWNFRAVKN